MSDINIENPQELEKYMGELKDEIDKYPGQKKHPHLDFNDDPLHLMTYGDFRGEKREWSHLRRNALTSSAGMMKDDPQQSQPLINWSNHYQNQESWEQIKKSKSNGDRHVINMTAPARKFMLTKFRNYIEEDDETVLLNPVDIIDLFLDKQKTADYLDQKGLPGIPSIRGDEFRNLNQDQVYEQIGEDEEHGYVLKILNGSSGDGVERIDSYDEVKRILDDVERIDELETDEFQVQPYVPHESDVRVVSAGEDIVNAERRYGPDGDFKTNISNLDGKLEDKDLGIYAKALKAVEKGKVEALNVDALNRLKEDEYELIATHNNGWLEPGAKNLAEDIVDSFTAEEFGFDPDLPNKPIKSGMDLIETTKEDISHLPDHVQERAIEYADGDKVYLVPELNGNPGSMIDLVSRWDGLEHQNTTMHIYNLMRELSGMEKMDIEYNVKNQDSQLWDSVNEWYPDLNQNTDEYIRKSSRNV